MPVKYPFGVIGLANCREQTHKNFFNSTESVTRCIHFSGAWLADGNVGLLHSPQLAKIKSYWNFIANASITSLIAYCYCKQMIQAVPSSGKNLKYIWLSNGRNT